MLALIENISNGLGQAYTGLRRRLSNPKRKGIGGGPLPPEHPDIETVKEQRYQFKTVYRGIKTIKVDVPIYQIQRIQVGFRGVKKKVPQFETKRVQVGFDTITKRVPVYTRKEIMVGTRVVKQIIPVTRFREKKVMEWKKVIKKVPVYKKVGKRRYLVGTRAKTSWKKVPVTKRIPYRSTKTITLQKPVYKDIKVLKGYRTEIEKIPRYQNKKVLVGYKTVKETEPVFENRKIQVGTKTVTRQVPNYQTVKIPLLPDPPPPVKNVDEKDQDGLDTLVEDLRFLKKLHEESDTPSPPTSFSKDNWDSLEKDNQPRIKSNKTPEPESSLLLSSLNFIYDNIDQ